jgi:hypothetical protein
VALRGHPFVIFNAPSPSTTSPSPTRRHKQRARQFHDDHPSRKDRRDRRPERRGQEHAAKLVVSLLRSDSGSIDIDGKDLKEFPIDDLRRLITVLFQQPFHYNSTVRDNILTAI